MRRLLLPVLACTLLQLAAVPGDATLLRNPDFSAQLTSWTQESGAWVHNLGDGIPGPGGTAGTTSAGAGTAALTQCVDVSSVPGGSDLALRAWVITVGHSSLSEVEIELFSAAACGGSLLAAASDPYQTPDAAQWNLTYTTIGVPAGGAASARVRLAITNGAGGEQTRFDAVRLDRSLISNGHFTTGLAGWTQNSGTWTRVADGLSTPPGAARAVVAGDGSAFLSQCVLLADHQASVAYLPLVRMKAETALDNTILSFLFFDDTACAGNLLSGPGLIASNTQLNAWETFASGLFVPFAVAAFPPDGAQSVAIFVALNPGQGTAGAVFLADDFAFVPSDFLFTDGVESGDTSAWSQTTP